MGYDLHIHRAGDWLDAAEKPIERTEWEEWVNRAVDFAFDPSFSVAYATEERGEWTEIAAIWRGHPSGKAISFWYYKGAITTTGADKDVIRRMSQVAAELSARVQGDDGEFYGPDGEQVA